MINTGGTFMIVLGIGAAAFIATFLGGLFALRFKDKLHHITGLSAGAIIGVAFFDLLPEAISLKNSTQILMINCDSVMFLLQILRTNFY
ncbi:MAG: hypothetical protein WAV76_17050 [Bacteroidota bacterium]